MKKGYIVELNNRRTIPIDEDEVIKVVEAQKSGSAVFVRKGYIANPNQISDIVVDVARMERLAAYNSMHREEIKSGKRKMQELTRLPDDFAAIRERLGKVAPVGLGEPGRDGLHA